MFDTTHSMYWLLFWLPPLLNQACRLIGSEVRDDIRKLVTFPNAITTWSDGTPLDEASRIWRNTERIKADIALHEASGADPWPVIEKTCGLLMSRHLA